LKKKPIYYSQDKCQCFPFVQWKIEATEDILKTREKGTVGANIHVTTNDQSGGKKEDGKHLDKNGKSIKKLILPPEALVINEEVTTITSK